MCCASVQKVKQSTCRKPHQQVASDIPEGNYIPLLLLLSFTLSRSMTSLYIIKHGAHAPPSVTVLASPACATRLAQLVINHKLLDWPGVEINGQTEESF